jgi:hypothetical protein
VLDIQDESQPPPVPVTRPFPSEMEKSVVNIAIRLLKITASRERPLSSNQFGVITGRVGYRAGPYRHLLVTRRWLLGVRVRGFTAKRHHNTDTKIKSFITNLTAISGMRLDQSYMDAPGPTAD